MNLKTEQEKKDYLENSNNRIYEQLSYAEAKNGVLIGLLGAAIIALINLALEETLDWRISLILYILSGVFMISLIVSICSFFPNTKALTKKRNIYFWGDIAGLENAEEYKAWLEDESVNLEDQLAEQNIQVSRIIRRKHKMFSIALKIMLSGLIPPLIIFYLIKGLIK